MFVLTFLNRYTWVKRGIKHNLSWLQSENAYFVRSPIVTCCFEVLKKPIAKFLSGLIIATKEIVTAFKQFTERFRTAWTETSADNNNEYRQFYRASDVSQARAIIFLLALTIALFGIGDYIYFGLTPLFYALLALRAGLIVYSLSRSDTLSELKITEHTINQFLLYMIVLVVGCPIHKLNST